VVVGRRNPVQSLLTAQDNHSEIDVADRQIQVKGHSRDHLRGDLKRCEYAANEDRYFVGLSKHDWGPQLKVHAKAARFKLPQQRFRSTFQLIPSILEKAKHSTPTTRPLFYRLDQSLLQGQRPLPGYATLSTRGRIESRQRTGQNISERPCKGDNSVRDFSTRVQNQGYNSGAVVYRSYPPVPPRVCKCCCEFAEKSTITAFFFLMTGKVSGAHCRGKQWAPIPGECRRSYLPDFAAAVARQDLM